MTDLERPRLKFHDLTEEATDKLCVFVVCPDEAEKNVFHVLYSNCGKERETHTYLYELGVEEDIVSEQNEPIGGGVIYLHTGEYRPSIHYEDVADDELRERVIHHLFRDA